MMAGLRQLARRPAERSSVRGQLLPVVPARGDSQPAGAAASGGGPAGADARRPGAVHGSAAERPGRTGPAAVLQSAAIVGPLGLGGCQHLAHTLDQGCGRGRHPGAADHHSPGGELAASGWLPAGQPIDSGPTEGIRGHGLNGPDHRVIRNPTSSLTHLGYGVVR